MTGRNVTGRARLFQWVPSKRPCVESPESSTPPFPSSSLYVLGTHGTVGTRPEKWTSNPVPSAFHAFPSGWTGGAHLPPRGIESRKTGLRAEGRTGAYS